MQCPGCGSENTVKNGTTVRGKPKRQCNACTRQFTVGATKRTIDKATWQLVDRLLLERIPLAGIARVTGISERHLQRYVNKKYGGMRTVVEVTAKKGGT